MSYLEQIAREMGIERLPGETNGQLQARVLFAMGGQPAQREFLLAYAAGVFGCPASRIALVEGRGELLVRVSAKVVSRYQLWDLREAVQRYVPAGVAVRVEQGSWWRRSLCAIGLAVP